MAKPVPKKSTGAVQDTNPLKRSPIRPIRSPKPIVPADPPKITNPGQLVATNYRIDLVDGTALTASGEHADLIYKYLQECEKICATNQLVNYLAPGLIHVDAAGKPINPPVK